ncbi:MAG TPA: hypothetical protein VM325_16260 [Alphaproteobacteria bacterium]|nr:hypothetical protein [Alphaproteobacteria bacterium]
MISRSKPKPHQEPWAIGVQVHANGRLWFVGPVVKTRGAYVFAEGYRISQCISQTSAKRAMTRWEGRLGLYRVVGVELLTAES